MKGNGFFKVEKGKQPKVADYQNAVDEYVRSPLEVAFQALVEALEVDPGKKVGDALVTIGAALKVWDRIDEEVIYTLGADTASPEAPQ